MTLNKIKSKCPRCDCEDADVLALISKDKKIVVVVKCLDKNHQYFFDSKGKNTEWKQFFK